MPSWVHAALLIGSCALATSAAATPPILVDDDRGIFARATSVQAGAFDEAIEPAEATSRAPFQASASISAATPLAGATSSASIDSEIDGSELAARGDTIVSSGAGAAGARGEAPGDSFFEVVFEATATEPFVLVGSIDADATGGDGYASVRLVDVGSGLALASHEAAPGQQQTFSSGGSVVAGSEYRLTAFAIAHALSNDGPGVAFADASYDATLFLPEPSRELGLLAGLALLSCLRGRGPGGPR